MSKIKLLMAAATIGLLFATSVSAFTFEVDKTKVTLGGYAKFDATYTDPGVATNGTILTPAQIPSTDSERDGTVDFSARESRVWFKTATDTGVGTLNTHVEFDFYGTGGNEYVSNSYGPRLRHAYGSLNGWLMGQTWTTFMDTAHLGELIDFSQHASTIFVRQAQIRYTHKLSNGSLMFALENPENIIKTEAGGSVSSAVDNNSIPDVIARWDIDGDKWHVSAAAMMRQFKTDDSGGDTEDNMGFAGSLTAKFNFPNKDSLSLQANGGALGRYMGLVAHPGATTDVTGDVDALNSYGGSIAYRHFWTPTVRSVIMLASTTADVDDDSTLLESTYSGHLNLLWDIAPKVRLGVEVRRTVAENGRGDDFELNRAQFSARYMF